MNLTDYKSLNKAVTAIVNNIDPAGLISGGAPSDEYNSEINSIISLIMRTTDEKVIAKEVSRIFKSSFNDNSSTQDQYNKIAAEVGKLINDL